MGNAKNMLLKFFDARKGSQRQGRGGRYFFFLHDFGQTHLNLIAKTTFRINNGNMDIFIHTTKYEKTKPFWPTESLNRIAQSLTGIG